MELSSSEIMAIELLKPHQNLIKQVLTPEGSIEINKLYQFFSTLERSLEVARTRRKTLFSDVEKTEVATN